MIARAETDTEIAATYDVMRQLRPHLQREEYLPLVRRMIENEGYRIAALHDDGVVRAVAGYRFQTMLYCPRLLLLDDFVTDETVRSRGHGAALLDWLRQEGRAAGCQELHLLSRVTREDAHRFYFRERFSIYGYLFRAEL